MGLGSVLRFFLPHDDKFLPYFEQSADNLKEAAVLYASLSKAANREELAAIRDQIKSLEHVGDKLTHNIFEELNKSFITPFDREDIYTLTKSLDDVLDLIDHVADIFVLYRIEKLEDGMSMLLEVTERARSSSFVPSRWPGLSSPPVISCSSSRAIASPRETREFDKYVCIVVPAIRASVLGWSSVRARPYHASQAAHRVASARRWRHPAVSAVQGPEPPFIAASRAWGASRAPASSAETRPRRKTRTRSHTLAGVEVGPR